MTVETTVRNTDWWREVIDLVEPDKLDWLHQAIRSDEYWSDFYVPDQLDSGDLEVEGNYHRYLADDGRVVIRVSQSATKVELARLVVAMYLHGATISIDPGFQSAHGLTDTDVHLLAGRDYGSFAVESEDEFIEFMSVIKPGTKLIVVGSKEAGIAALQENPDLFVIDSPITKSGRATQLAFYREQSISITQHRFGAISSELVNIFKPVV